MPKGFTLVPILVLSAALVILFIVYKSFPLKNSQIINTKVDYFTKLINKAEYTKTGHPVYYVYEQPTGKKANKLFEVSDYTPVLLKQKQLIASLSKNGFLVYNLKEKQLTKIPFKDNEQINAGNLIVSSNQDYAALSLFSQDKPQLLVLGLNSFQRKIIYSPENTPFRFLIPAFFSKDQKSLYYFISAGEGGSNLSWVNIDSQQTADTDMPLGVISPDSSKMVYFDKLPPYGGCYHSRSFKLGWYDLTKNYKFNTIATENNAIFDFVSWDNKGDEFIYTKRPYQPRIDNYPACPEADFKTTETYVYNLVTNQVRTITSAENQKAEWNPDQKEFNTTHPEPDIWYLGTLNQLPN